MRLIAGIAIVVVALVGARDAGAHESRPLYVEIAETAPNAFVVTWKIPPSALNVTSPVVLMPGTCTASGAPAGTRLVKRQLFTCKSDLSGARIGVDFPRYNPSISTLFRFERLSGEKHTAIRGPKDPTWRVPDSERTVSVAKEYLVLGIEHILKGYDHLLFVACLVLIAGTWRRILITVTGFTIAHSITLALAALDVVRVPVPPVEAVIALSIVFLATEIARERRDTLTWRYPIVVAGSFGLLHGFGFASVLSEIGLPQTEIPAALLLFNLGVEVGQVLFVALIVGAISALSGLRVIPKPNHNQDGGLLNARMARPCAYLVGALASYWMIVRIADFAA
ncbi:MAG: HupE/UreJ family protein [Methyloligellaceae bacterium]